MMEALTYQDVSAFALSWGRVFLVMMFLVAVGYAAWPRNRGTFEKAARVPLEED